MGFSGSLLKLKIQSAGNLLAEIGIISVNDFAHHRIVNTRESRTVDWSLRSAKIA